MKENLWGEEEDVLCVGHPVEESFPPSNVVSEEGRVEEERDVKEGAVTGSTLEEAFKEGLVSREDGSAAFSSNTGLEEERFSAPVEKAEFRWDSIRSAASFLFVERWGCLYAFFLLLFYFLKMQKAFFVLSLPPFLERILKLSESKSV